MKGRERVWRGRGEVMADRRGADDGVRLPQDAEAPATPVFREGERRVPCNGAAWLGRVLCVCRLLVPWHTASM